MRKSNAYSKKQQVGRKGKRSQDDEKPQSFEESPFHRDGFPISPTPDDISSNGLDGQAHGFSMDGVNTKAECENCGHIQDVYNREDCEKCGKSEWGSIRNDEEE